MLKGTPPDPQGLPSRGFPFPCTHATIHSFLYLPTACGARKNRIRFMLMRLGPNNAWTLYLDTSIRVYILHHPRELTSRANEPYTTGERI